MAKKVESLAEETRPENEAENFSGKNAAQEDSEKEANASGICCYIGPSLRGLIKNGDIFRGSRDDALKAAAAAVETDPMVKTLIVSGDALPVARRKVKTPGSALYRNYQRVAGRK